MLKLLCMPRKNDIAWFLWGLMRESSGSYLEKPWAEFTESYLSCLGAVDLFFPGSITLRPSEVIEGSMPVAYVGQFGLFMSLLFFICKKSETQRDTRCGFKNSQLV